MIVGVTGTLRGGKDTAAKHLVSKGFVHYSLSDHIRTVATGRGLDARDRTTLQNIGNELRTTHGPGYLAEKALEFFEDGKNYVATSIRNPAEIEALKRNHGFVLLSLDAPIRDRYDRSVISGDKNVQTFEEFVQSEEREKSSDPNGLQLPTCIKMADYHIFNEGVGPDSIENFVRKLDDILAQIQKERRLR